MEGKSDRLNFGHNDSQTHFAIESKFNLMGYRYGKATVFFDPESKSDFSVGDTQPSMGCHESLSSGVGVRGPADAFMQISQKEVTLRSLATVLELSRNSVCMSVHECS
ncbi:hypothetical protein F2P81_019319 [Scophthalmus maximus]|uniref:Uncharacterized protein n=1 Tax=Scophthalmus maximus TaxID=52904 RepID=A0A6A4SC75_SCOMX|nr:hypothetical protein F2P81_019319 [Scophthalmus maximus]